MGDIVQLDIFGNEDPILKKGEKIYQHSMKDGTVKRVVGVARMDRPAGAGAQCPGGAQP